jgi:hypothetical protein
VDFVFADDSRQLKPSRLGAGKFIALGGLHVAGDHVGFLERFIDQLCKRIGFPPDEQFKWSPGANESFMRTVLQRDRRTQFYEELFRIAREFEVSASVVMVDSNYRPAIEASETPEMDATALFLERASYALGSQYKDGVVVVAMPSGGASEGQRFVAECLGLIESGTGYQSLSNLPLGVFAAQSRQLRLLQLADVITSCTVARVSGETRYSPHVFELIKPLLRRGTDRIGGIGLKIHPEYIYQNLYYWLLNDRSFWRDGAVRTLPDPNRPFADHPNEALIAGELARESNARARESGA